MSAQDDLTKDEKLKRDEELNRQLEETFPASDPLSITRAAKDEPPEGDGENDEAELDKAEEIGFASEAGNR